MLLSIRGIVTVLVLAALFTLAVIWSPSMTAGKAKAAAEIAPPAMSAVTIRKRRISECRAPGVSHGEPFFIVS